MSSSVPIGELLPLEEFSSFVSSIKCFGRSIIPPLVTQNQKELLIKLKEAAIQKEIDLRTLKKKRSAVKKLDFTASSAVLTSAQFERRNVEPCAFLFPSSPEKLSSVAISKMPTSNIFSSVHTDAIVCTGLTESNGKHSTLKIESTERSQCSHLEIVFDCPLCQAENNPIFQNHRFVSELSPEVPCRIDSLVIQSQNLIEDEQNSLVETDCESLPTVICSQRPDTDTDSSVTCFTQSTDLEKYMEVSCDLNSSDNSGSAWDSQSTSQQFSMSRSDEASSGTVINTENELTPCASTLAELTDNIDDEPSIVEEASQTAGPVNLRRAHSVDSYMKMIHMCANNAQVKKSASDPLNASTKAMSHSTAQTIVPNLSKGSQLIKEDSKESEESTAQPEKDLPVKNDHQNISAHGKITVPTDLGQENMLPKNHVRRNSYTLDHPSPVLIQAHSDCNCSFDGNATSPPHCSALRGKDAINTAFTKERVEINIPPSLEAYPILNASAAVDEVTEDKDKTNANIKVSEMVNGKPCCESLVDENIQGATAEEKNADSTILKEKETDKTLLSLPTTYDKNDLNNEHFNHIFEEVQKNYAAQVKDLMEEQKKQLLKLTRVYEEKGRLLYENHKHLVLSLQNLQSPSLNDKESIPVKDVSENLHTGSSNAKESFDEPTIELGTETFKKDSSMEAKASLSSQVNPSSTALLPAEDEAFQESCLFHDSSGASENLFSHSTAVLLPPFDSQTYPSSDLNSPCNYEEPLPLCSCLESAGSFENTHDSRNRLLRHETVAMHKCGSPNSGISISPTSVSTSMNELSAVVNSSISCDLAPDEPIRISKSSENVSSSLEASQPKNLSNKKLVKSTSALPLDVPVNDIISLCKRVKSGSSRGDPRKIEIPLSVLNRFKKLPAFVKGYLTRRLFRTERVQHLVKTLQDTAVLIRKVSEDISLKGNEVSEKDVIFHKQLIVQLMTTFHNVYDIFCTISTKEQMAIIAESRNLRLKKEIEQKGVLVNSQESVSDLSKNQKMPSAMTKALDKKKRFMQNSRTYTVDVKNLRSCSAIDSRTYTVEDLKSHVGRPTFQSASKSHPSSPSSIYKVSVGLAHKRKTTVCKSSSSRRSVQHNWVP